MSERRAEYDVTDRVKVTNTSDVLDVIHDVFSDVYKKYDISTLNKAFEDCNDLFDGRYLEYLPCDTLYHDRQHTLDMTLALARFINGHDRSVAKADKIGAERALIAVITALYHDSGYLRSKYDSKHHNGAEYTLCHVSRSSRFLKRYFQKLGMDEAANISSQMVHYTGYEINLDKIVLPDLKLHIAGHMLGSADLMAQMSDRCYLEKCRDRLYPEFVMGGLAVQRDKDGNEKVIYSSAADLLNKSSDFYKNEVQVRLDKLFHKVYNYEAAHFDGEHLYGTALSQNQSRLKRVVDNGSNFDLLKRKPPENYGTKNFPGLEEYLALHPHLAPNLSRNVMPQ